MVQIVVAIGIGGIGIVNAVLFWFLPRLTRPDLYFAVTVHSGFRDQPDGKLILRRYRIALMLFSALALAVFAFGVFWFGAIFVPGGFFLQLVAAFVAFYRARLRVLPHAVPPTTIREAELQPRGRIVPGGWIAAVGPFLLVAGCAAYLWFHLQDLPARFPVHWGPAGRPDRWAGRTSANVYFLRYLLTTTGILTALAIMLYGMTYWLRPVYAGGAQGARELRFRRTVSGIVLAAEYFLAIQSSWIALMPLRRAGAPGGPLIALVPLFFVLAVVIVLARLGQGGSRTAATGGMPSTTSAVPVGDRTPDRYWKLGIFYFNPNDPAVLIERRFGLGYTLNFARPASWTILLIVIAGVVVPVLVSRLQG